jgi:dTDP-4-dehydrorhamnose reductase
VNGIQDSDSILVVGSSGFLGWCIASGLSANTIDAVFTYCNTPYFPTSVRYDFFKDDISNILNITKVSTVIFTAMVEAKLPIALQTSMERFTCQCRDKRIVYLSSDGIFDGGKGWYSEGDIPAPCTRYGHNLLLCEQLIARNCSNFCIIRPSYIYGFFHEQLDKRLSHTRNALQIGEAVTLFEDMYKSPLGVQQVAEAIIELSRSDYIGIVHVAGERLSIFDFHSQAMKALGVDTSRLQSCSMPASGEFLRDTSLQTSLWQRLTGMKPLNVQETLSNSS